MTRFWLVWKFFWFCWCFTWMAKALYSFLLGDVWKIIFVIAQGILGILFVWLFGKQLEEASSG